MSEDSSVDIILEQLETLLVFLQRPVVQLQVSVVILVVLVAYLVSGTLGRLTRRIASWLVAGRDDRRIGKFVSFWIAVLEGEFFSVAVLLLGNGAVVLLEGVGEAVGLIQNIMVLFWVLLGYRIAITLLYAVIRRDLLQVYHYRIFNPLFALIIAGLILSRLINIENLARIELFQLFDTTITVGTLFISVLVLYTFIVIRGLVGDLIQLVMSPQVTHMQPGEVQAVIVIIEYIVLAVGIIVALGTLGFDFTTLAVIGGGLSVGIGFGLQQIVANFLSGILLLFEQSLRPGDVIELGERIGTVEKLSIRSTTVRTLNGIEVIIPNERFLTNEVITYTRTNHQVRLLLDVGVSYRSEPKEVRRILLDVANKHGLVLDKPAPVVFFAAFGDSSINFKLGVWIDQPIRIMVVRSDLYFMIWEALEKAHIEIPFPQRDLNLRDGWTHLLDQQPPAPMNEVDDKID